MLIDRPQITENSTIINATVASGSDFPTDPSIGELFYHTGLGALQTYTGAAWVDVGNSPIVQGKVDTLTASIASASSNAGTALATHAADATLHLTSLQNTLLDGLTLPDLTSTQVNYLIGVTSPIQTQLDDIRSVKFNVSGGTITGSLAVTGTLSVSPQPLVSSGITGLGTPFGSTDAVNKYYVDTIITGLSWKQAVSVATTANIALSGFQTIDGYTTVAKDRVLVKNQTNQAENGIYTVNAGPWQRATDTDAAGELTNAAVFVSNGTTWGNTGWVQTTPTITLGSTAIVWSQFAGGNIGAIVAGNGINVVGLNVSVNAGAGLTSGTQLTVNTSPRVVINASQQVDLASLGVGYAKVVGGSGTIPQVSIDDYGRVVSLQGFTPNTDNIIEGTTPTSNLYFTTARAQSALDVSGGGISYTNGVITLNSTGAASTMTLVQRDINGSFAANVITANSFVGPATLNVLKTGDTMTGHLWVQAGIRAAGGAPANSDVSNVGFSFDDDGDTGLFTYGGNSATHSNLSLYLNSVERFKIVDGGNVLIDNSIVWHQGNVLTLNQLPGGPGFIDATALTPYATTASLSNYVTTTALNTALTPYATTASLSSYVTATALNTALTPYATTASLSSYVTATALNTALTPYATTTALNTALSSYATTASLSSYTLVNGSNAVKTNGAWPIDINGYATSVNVISNTASAIVYPVWSAASTGVNSLATTAGMLSFNPGTGDLMAGGNVTAYSDRRLKDNIEVIPNALAKVDQLTGVTFTRNDTDCRGTGLIAQDVLKVLPEAVVTNEDGYLSLAYGNLVGLLVEAIKELKAEVEELKARQA
jgi:hypothetical protein